MSRRALSGCLAAAALLILQAGVRADQAQIRKTGPVFSADKGRFRIMLGGATVGTEQFDIAPDGDAWVARSSTDLQAPNGGEMKTVGELRLTAEGAPLHY